MRRNPTASVSALSARSVALWERCLLILCARRSEDVLKTLERYHADCRGTSRSDRCRAVGALLCTKLRGDLILRTTDRRVLLAIPFIRFADALGNTTSSLAPVCVRDDRSARSFLFGQTSSDQLPVVAGTGWPTFAMATSGRHSPAPLRLNCPASRSFAPTSPIPALPPERNRSCWVRVCRQHRSRAT